jgi:hypothetical protein
MLTVQFAARRFQDLSQSRPYATAFGSGSPKPDATKKLGLRSGIALPTARNRMAFPHSLTAYQEYF